MLRLAAMVLLCGAAFGQRNATEAEIKAKDLTVLPTGAGLPAGHGNAVRGKDLFKEKCAVCHNDHGEGREGQYVALVGGIGSLKTGKPVRTVGSYWPYATTIFDYVRRAMPYDHPRSLSADDVYSACAVILFMNGIITDTQEMNEKTLPQVKMPNRDGFVPDARPDVKSKR
jgi:S-disulfanyl-L-cysteine oxidoreductase SoxD